MNVRQDNEDIQKDHLDSSDESNRALVDDTRESDSQGAPEPPPRWNPQAPDRHVPSPQGQPDPSQMSGTGAIGPVRFTLQGDEAIDFQSARKMMSAAQIIAIVSLFFGGVLLSSVAVVSALVAYRKLNRVARAHDSEPEVQRAIRRSGIIVIALTVGALVINIVAIAYLYPLLVQSGDLGSLFANTGQTGAAAGNSTWG